MMEAIVVKHHQKEESHQTQFQCIVKNKEEKIMGETT